MNVITIVDVSINVKKKLNNNRALYHFRHYGSAVHMDVQGMA